MESVVKETLKYAPGDYVEIRLEDTVQTLVQFRGKELENIGSSMSAGGCVRTRVGGFWGFVSFNDISDLKQSVINAEKQARLIASIKSSHETTSELAEVETVVDSVHDNPDHDPTLVSLDEKEALTREYNNILLTTKGITTTIVDYRDTAKNIIYANSEGTCIERREVEAGCRFLAIARDGTNVQKGIDGVGNRRCYGVVQGLHERVEQVAKDALDLLKAPKVAGGLYTVIIDPQLCGVFAHEAFGHLSEADFIYENPRAREMMTLGRRFGTEELTIVDDGTIKGERGCDPYDDEGVPTRKTKLIDEGVLRGRLHSRETAGKMGENVTGNARAINYRNSPIVRMRCTYIEPRSHTFDDMIGGISKGIYAVGSMGGTADMERFTFSAKRAYLIKDGKIDSLLRDVVLAGNVFKTLQNIDAIGDDLKIFGGMGGCGKAGQFPLPVSLGGPHVRIQNVLIG